MGVYLVDNPPRIRQYRSPRRAKPSGVVVVHTAESFPDETGPDTGAENVARFIRDRTNYGSYHDLADSDSIIQLVRYGDEAFHDGTGSNPHSYGVSAATQAAKWNAVGDDWANATVVNMAKATARYARWIKTNYGITIPARRITRAQSENRVPGFLSHAERDPARRTDPGKTFPWNDFLVYYSDEMEDDMPITDSDAKKIASANWHYLMGRPGGGEDLYALTYLRYGWWDGKTILKNQAKQLVELAAIKQAVGAVIDKDAVAQQVAALTVPAVVAALADMGQLTEQQVEDAAEQAIRNVLGTLDEEG